MPTGAPAWTWPAYEMHDIEVVVDRLVSREGIERRLTDSVEAALRLADGVVQIEVVKLGAEGAAPDLDVEPGEILTFSQHLARPSDGKSFEELAPRNFSFNSPYGACPQCDGLGTRFEVDPDLVVPDPSLSLAEGALAPWASGHSQYYERLLESTAEELGVEFDAPWETLPPKAQAVFLHGGLGRRVQVRYRNRYGRVRSYNARFEGVIPNLQRLHSETGSDNSRQRIEGYMREVPCAHCGGARLRPLPLAVTIDGRNINDVCTLSIRDAAKLFDEIRLSERDALIADQVLKELRSRLGFLLAVGLDYLTLARSAGTLSGGEAQRIRLASQIGSGLVGVLYVLDEPSIGLHQRDNARLLDTLLRLRDLPNTVIVVEHDEETIRTADHVVDIGPGAGSHGGDIVHSGPVEALLRNEESLTGQYLSGAREIPVPQLRRPPGTDWLVVRARASTTWTTWTWRSPWAVSWR